MENLENNVVNNEIQENTEVEAKEVKTFTQDELNKIVAERIAKEKKKLEAERLKQQRRFFHNFATRKGHRIPVCRNDVIRE